MKIINIHIPPKPLDVLYLGKQNGKNDLIAKNPFTLLNHVVPLPVHLIIAACLSSRDNFFDAAQAQQCGLFAWVIRREKNQP